MKRLTVTIPGRLPGLNEMIEGRRIVYRGGADAYTMMKRKESARIIGAIVSSIGTPIPRLRAVELEFRWYEPNYRRDPDNIAAGGRKLILDAMTALKIVENDGWRHVIGWKDRFHVDRERPRVEVIIKERRRRVISRRGRK